MSNNSCTLEWHLIQITIIHSVRTRSGISLIATENCCNCKDAQLLKQAGRGLTRLEFTLEESEEQPSSSQDAINFENERAEAIRKGKRRAIEPSPGPIQDDGIDWGHDNIDGDDGLEVMMVRHAKQRELTTDQSLIESGRRLSKKRKEPEYSGNPAAHQVAPW